MSLVPIILLYLAILYSSNAYKINDTCQTFCNCDLTQNSLTILCNQPITTFSLPSKSADPNLFYASTIIARLSFLQQFPKNLCDFNVYLNYLDLSENSINTNITTDTFKCLTQLRVLNVSFNSLRYISEAAFDSTYSLKTIDLSNNRIQFLPLKLFVNKLPNLEYIFLQNNLIQEIDTWYFTLAKLIKVDLSNNMIEKLTNNLNLDIYNQTYVSQLQPQINLLDMRKNRIFKFDDNTLKSFKVCDADKLSSLLSLFFGLRLEENRFHCSCEDSYNLMRLFKQATIQISNPIFQTKCTTPIELNSESIFSFVDKVNVCNGTIGTAFNKWNCPVNIITTTTTSTTTTTTTTTTITTTTTTTGTTGTTTTTTTTTTSTTTIITFNIDNPSALVSEPDKTLPAPINTTAFRSHIVGIVLGFTGLLVFLLALLICLCPIEFLSICFSISPCCFIYCPCKSSQVSNKPYDIFISYNKSSIKWIQTNLIPFLDLNDNTYFLHYDTQENPTDEVFNQVIKEKINQSKFLLLVLSDKYLINEWTDPQFTSYVHETILRSTAKPKSEQTQLVCIQLHDVSDEEVDEYIRDKFQMPKFISLETDEFFFWKKLGYILHLNEDFSNDRITPIHYEQTKEIELNTRDILSKPNDLLNFRHYSIDAPIIHVPSEADSYGPKSIRRAEKVRQANEINDNTGYEVTHIDYTPDLVQQSIISQLSSKRKSYMNEEVVVDLSKVKKNEAVILKTRDNRLEFAVNETPSQYRVVSRDNNKINESSSNNDSYYKPRLLSDESDLYDFD